jgi:hypothetical protein
MPVGGSEQKGGEQGRGTMPTSSQFDEIHSKNSHKHEIKDLKLPKLKTDTPPLHAQIIFNPNLVVFIRKKHVIKGA